MSAVYKRRQFLNTETNGGNAFVSCYVNAADGNNVSAEITLSDCNRQITLDFCVYGNRDGADAEQLANVRQKIAKLRKAIVSFETALLGELDCVDVE